MTLSPRQIVVVCSVCRFRGLQTLEAGDDHRTQGRRLMLQCWRCGACAGQPGVVFKPVATVPMWWPEPADGPGLYVSLGVTGVIVATVLFGACLLTARIYAASIETITAAMDPRSPVSVAAHDNFCATRISWMHNTGGPEAWWFREVALDQLAAICPEDARTITQIRYGG